MINKPIHVNLFNFGVLYYFVIPIVVGHFNLFEYFPGMKMWHYLYRSKFESQYLLLILFSSFSFYFGSFIVLNFFKVTTSSFLDFSSGSFYKFSFFLIFFAQILIYFNRKYLFTGYTLGYDKSFLGNIGTINILLTFIFLYLKINQFVQKKYLIISIFITELSIILLSMGSRMYVLIPLLAYLIYSFYLNKISYKKILFFLFSILILLIFVGLWRSNYNFSIISIVFLLLAETLFTWYSVSSLFIYNNTLPFFVFPNNYFSSFINFLPSFLFPDKSSYIFSASQNIYYYSPFGADSILVSVITNFGLVGFPFFFFIIGCMYSLVYKMIFNKFWNTYYILICAILPFQFFRDNFAILNKMFFYNLLLLPFLIFSINSFFKKILTRYND